MKMDTVKCPHDAMPPMNTYLDTFGPFFITLSRFKGTLIYILQKNKMIKGFLPVLLGLDLYFKFQTSKL